MADLTELQAAGIVKVVGSDSSGLETNPVRATPSGDLAVTDVCNTAGLYKNLSVSTTPLELKVGVSALTNRKVATALPMDGTIYYGYNSSVTASTGTPIFTKQHAEFLFTENVTIYLVAATGTVDVRITEGS